MTVPVFDFTDRARPVVQFGRSEHPVEGTAHWGLAHWGLAHWGRVAWEPVWTDVTCEIHEITVDVGRAGAVDRFVPGTAAIVASNVNNLSDMIWPPVIPPIEYELVPQPPISHEEDLQAPTAATVVSNGWSFSDDFETAPRWRFPTGWAAAGSSVAPCGPLKVIDGAWEPDLYWDPVIAGYTGNGAAQWIGSYDPDEASELGIVLAGFDWPTAPTAGTPELRVDLCLQANRNTRECFAARFRFVPVFGGANQIYAEWWQMGPDGSKVAGTAHPTPYTVGTGTNGIFGTRTLSAALTHPSANTQTLMSMPGVFDHFDGFGSVTLGSRIGLFVSWTQGAVAGATVGGPRITAAVGADFVDDLRFPAGAGWILPGPWRRAGYPPAVQVDGAMIPSYTFNDLTVSGSPADQNGEYAGRALAQWVSDFVGDQVIEVEVAGMSWPDPPLSFASGSYFELYTHAAAGNRAAMVARIKYDWGAGWNDPIIGWSLAQQAGAGESVDPDPIVSGTIDPGTTAGLYPEPARWRFESDLTGEQRLFYQGTLLATVTVARPATGSRVGLYLETFLGAPETVGDRRPTGLRVEQVWAGLQEPLGTEDLGTWVRVGVDHDTLGNRWLFRGFVDGIVPTYVPDRPDAVRIECIDALGEAGRVAVDGEQMSHRFAAAPTRIRQILDAAHWPQELRDVHDDSTLMSRPPSGTAVEALTRVAESCGGAVYGDPISGHVVFRGRDWQGTTVAAGPVAAITNFPDVDISPQICPAGWEMSKRRSDIITRVRFTTVTSDSDDGAPIVREWRSPQAERIYGVELYEATLLCITGDVLTELAVRELRIEGARDMPRIEACLLDASTAPEALDLMATATFTRPTVVRCQLHRPGGIWVINRNYIVTGQRHVLKPEQWTCRLTLDLSSPFYQGGGRWGETARPRGRWGVDVWARNF